MLQIFLPLFNPNAISFFGLNIRWYSLAYIFGVIFVYKFTKYFDKKFNLKFGDEKFYDDFVFFEVLGIIIGGRIAYCLVYNIEEIFENPIKIFAIWEGGMSFHGGFLGVLLSTLYLCKKYKIDFLRFTDVISISTPIALFFGRLANFINLELYGRPTNVPWSMIFPTADALPRHPSQLYEATMEGVVLFIIMLFITKKNKLKTKGLNSSLFLIFYGIFRIFCEFFREPDYQLGFILFNNVTMGQILSLPLIIAGLYILFLLNSKKSKN